MDRRVRTGCITCRKRRVKCDEAKPICGRCRSASVVCEGYNLPRRVLEAHLPPASAERHTPLPHEEISFPRLSWKHQDQRQEELSVYHHFVTTTAVRLFRNDHIRFWRDEVAQMSYGLHFVYEALLGISAIHHASLLAYRGDNVQEVMKLRVIGIRAYGSVLRLLPGHLAPTTAMEKLAILVVLIFLTYFEVCYARLDFSRESY
jgi:hypothetical protein